MSDILCDCGANNDLDARACWLCGRELEPSDQQPPAPASDSGARFTLAWLMLLVTLIAVCLGVELQIQGLGIALGIVSLPAMIRTTSIARRRGARGRALSTAARVEVFFVSLIIVVLILLASCVAFCATCVPVGLLSLGFINDGGGILLAVAVGLVAAIAVSVFVARRLWPDEHSNPPRPLVTPPPPPPHDDNS